MITAIKTTIQKLVKPLKKGKKKALVTGGNGFIGSHIVDALVKNPEFDEVRIIDNQ